MKPSASALFSLVIQQDAMTELMKLLNAEKNLYSEEPRDVKEGMYSLMLFGKAELKWRITMLTGLLNARLALWR